MVGILIVTHGKMAEGLLDAMQLIVGRQENIQAISLNENDSISGLGKEIEQAATQLNDGSGILILVDLFGASPFNASAQFALQQDSMPIEVITGVNLPILIEIATQRTETTSLEEMLKIAKSAADRSIKFLSEEWQKHSED